MNLRIKKTKKLFYKKWPYKIECRVLGANRLRYHDINSVINWCSNTYDWRTKYWDEKNINKAELLLFVNQLKPFLEKELQTRSEGSHYNIFCADTILYNDLKKSLEPWIEAVTEPENEKQLTFLLAHNGKKVIVNSLPWDDFKYKIILRNNLKPEMKENLVKWMKNYPDNKLRMSNSTESWLLNKTWYMQDPFFYISDDSMLTFVHLFIGDSIKTIEEFVLKETV